MLHQTPSMEFLLLNSLMILLDWNRGYEKEKLHDDDYDDNDDDDDDDDDARTSLDCPNIT